MSNFETILPIGNIIPSSLRPYSDRHQASLNSDEAQHARATIARISALTATSASRADLTAAMSDLDASRTALAGANLNRRVVTDICSAMITSSCDIRQGLRIATT